MPSTVIRDYRYRQEEETLEITFKSGKRYRYLHVPQRVYRDMQSSSSKGEYFNRHIREQFAFERVTPLP